ncbi:hypothetical protein F5B18DRAFT_629514 [Nemania serpens]|nr:hypothetical protein F5B18DRAFT_629514 [Nemania serpens]
MQLTVLSLLTLVTLGQAQNSCSIGLFTDTTTCNIYRVAQAAQIGPGTTCTNHKNEYRATCGKVYSGLSTSCTWSLWAGKDCTGGYYARYPCGGATAPYSVGFYAGEGQSLSVTCT